MNSAYITLLTTDSFLKGVLLLKKSLDKTHPSYPFYVFITGDKLSQQSINVLKQQQIQYIIDSSAPVTRDLTLIQDKEQQRWLTTFEKLKIFRLTQFSKIVFLDTDMCVLNNLDSLFERQPFSAVRSRANVHGKDYFSFNSGLMVIEPSDELYYNIIEYIKPTVEYSTLHNLPCGDQNVLNNYYNDWHLHQELHLPDGYNVFWGSMGSYFNDGYSIQKSDKRLYIAHFTGKHKPWDNFILFFIKSAARSLYNMQLSKWSHLRILLRYYYD